MTTNKIKMYFDCDTGVDDAMALGYLISEPSKVEILGIGSVCGNIDAPSGAHNTLNLLHLAGIDSVPVAIGEIDYLNNKYICDVQHIHGENGIGNVSLSTSPSMLSQESAPEMLVRLARENPGSLSILATGPLTNIARAIELEPNLPSLISTLTIMGGTANAPGNRTPVAEANIACDPEAADVVFKQMNNIVMVPLDVTMSHTFEESDKQKLLHSDGKFARKIGQMLELYSDFYINVYGRKACALHDPVAAVLAVEGLVSCVAPKVSVVIDKTTGPGRGQTICDMRGKYKGYPQQENANCYVVLSTGINMSEHLINRLLSV